MKRTWIKNLFSKPTRPAARFSPRLDPLEARDVPATFYVNPPSAVPPANGDPVTFNAGRPDEFNGTFGTNVFESLNDAVTAANALAGTDTIRLAHTGADFLYITSAVDTPLTITGSLNIVGSGASASVLTTTNDQGGAVLLVTGAGVQVNLSDLSFFGGAAVFDAGGIVDAGGGQTGTAIRYTVGTTGTIDRTVWQGTFADGFDGVAIEATGTNTAVTVQNSQFSVIGRVGVLANSNASVSLYGNIYTGKGGVAALDYFAQISSGATAVISGNTVSGNQGVAGGDSAAVLVSQAGGAAATATLFGNTFTGNINGIIVGDNVADTSSVVASYNNIFGNLNGIGTNRAAAAPDIDATNVWWGTASGPFNAANNPTGSGNDVANDVLFAPVRGAAVPVLAAPTLAAYQAAAFPQAVSVTLVTNAAEPGTNGVLRFTRTGDPATALTVNYTPSGTATAGFDYVILPNVVNFAAGQTIVDVPVTVLDDVAVEAVETVTVTIDPGLAYAITAPGTATVNITSDDVVPPVPPVTLPKEFGAGQDKGGGAVTFYNPNGSVRFTVSPFGAGFTGGVRTAAADFNNDGIADLVVGTGPGIATSVKILNGANGAELFTVAPFEAAFTGGVYVAAGDINGDGKAELVISPDEGGGPRVQVYSGNGFAKLADFFGINDPNFRGGARPAVGDINGDGKAELVVSAGFGGGPRVSVYTGASIGNGTPTNLFGDFFLFEQTLRNGSFVGVGDINGDGKGDLIGGGGPGGGPRVLAFSGVDLVAGKGDKSAALINFFAGDQNARGGIRVTAKDLNGDANADLVVGDGTGAGSRVTGYSGAAFNGGGANPILNLTAFPGFTGGVFVG